MKTGELLTVHLIWQLLIYTAEKKQKMTITYQKTQTLTGVVCRACSGLFSTWSRIQYDTEAYNQQEIAIERVQNVLSPQSGKVHFSVCCCYPCAPLPARLFLFVWPRLVPTTVAWRCKTRLQDTKHFYKWQNKFTSDETLLQVLKQIYKYLQIFLEKCFGSCNLVGFFFLFCFSCTPVPC